MFSKIKFTLAATTVALLAACGGGDDANTADNPLSKYAGVYYVCDEHTRKVSTATAVGSDTLHLNFKEETYSGNNCTGSVVGTFSYTDPLVATYKSSQSDADMPAVTLLASGDRLLPEKATVDMVEIVVPTSSATLVGSGVDGLCVTTDAGQECYGEEDFQEHEVEGEVGLALVGEYFLVEVDGSVDGYVGVGEILSSDSSFNLNVLAY